MNIEKALIKAINKGLKQAGEELTKTLEDFSNDSLKVTPMYTGDLRRSYSLKADGKEIAKGSEQANIKVNDVKIDIRKGVEIEASYGDKKTEDYAVIVHEFREKNYTTPGTDFKYLERPFRNYEKEFSKAIAKGLKKVLK